DALAGEDDRAVDQAGEYRRNLSRRNRDHGLVQECDAFRGLLRLDQALATAEQSQREQVGVPEALRHRYRLVKARAGALRLPLAHGEQTADDEAVALLDAPVPTSFQQAPGPGKPAGRLSGLPGKERLQAEPEALAGGTLDMALVRQRPVGARPDAGRVSILADQLGRWREPLEIVRPVR